MRGSIRNLKKKDHPQNRKKQQQQQKFDQKPKTACKTVKTYKCSHPSSQSLNRSDTELTSAAHRGFAAFRGQWRRIMTALVEEKPESKQENPKTTSEIKSKAH